MKKIIFKSWTNISIWLIIFLTAISLNYTFQKIFYEQEISFGKLEIIILVLIIFSTIKIKVTAGKIDYSYWSFVTIIHPIFSGFLFIDFLDQFFSNKWASLIWTDSIMIVSILSLIILLKNDDFNIEKTIKWINILGFSIFTNTFLNIIDPYIYNYHWNLIEIFIILTTLIIYNLHHIKMFNVVTFVESIITGLILGFITYHGMVRGWIRINEEIYGIPNSVMALFGTIIFIILPWLLHIRQRGMREFNKT